MHKKHPEDYPPSWKFVVNSTEDFVKYQQDWPINIKRREKEEEQKKQKEEESARQKSQGKDDKEQHDGEESDTRGSETSDEQKGSSASEGNGSESSDDNNDEDDWRHNHGSDRSDKHHSAYGPGVEDKQGADEEYKRLREKYTPQEIALLRTVQHEKLYMHSLGQNDGSMESPAKIRVAHDRIFGIDKQDTMTPDNW